MTELKLVSDFITLSIKSGTSPKYQLSESECISWSYQDVNAKTEC